MSVNKGASSLFLPLMYKQTDFRQAPAVPLSWHVLTVVDHNKKKVEKNYLIGSTEKVYFRHMKYCNLVFPFKMKYSNIIKSNTTFYIILYNFFLFSSFPQTYKKNHPPKLKCILMRHWLWLFTVCEWFPPPKEHPHCGILKSQNSWTLLGTSVKRKKKNPQNWTVTLPSKQPERENGSPEWRIIHPLYNPHTTEKI